MSGGAVALGERRRSKGSQGSSVSSRGRREHVDKSRAPRDVVELDDDLRTVRRTTTNPGLRWDWSAFDAGADGEQSQTEEQRAE